jgi:hypothetical protein
VASGFSERLNAQGTGDVAIGQRPQRGAELQQLVAVHA